VGLIIAIQAETGQGDLGDIFTDEALRRRIDHEQGEIDLNGLVQSPIDARKFVLQALAYLIDQEAAAKIISQEQLPTTPDIFPFVDDGISALADHVTQNIEKDTPSGIISVMGNAAIEAWDRRHDSSVRRLIDRQIIDQTAYPDTRPAP
jgi:hypothetical protein